MMKSKLNLHLQENNPESLSHLENNEQKFSDQCMMILRLLNQGVRLSVKTAIDNYGIASLPRRLADLKHKNNINNIQDEWVKDGNGKRLFKEWFILQPSRPTKGEIVEKWNKELQQGPVQEVTLRDGTILKTNDEVECTAYPQCAGETFIISEMTPWPHCESGVMIVAYLKGDPERKLRGFKKEGRDLGPDGLDSNNFRRIYVRGHAGHNAWAYYRNGRRH